MPQGVIARVEHMGLEQGQPLMIGGMPIFEWAPGIAIIDDVNDNIDFDIEEDYLPDDETNDENEEDDLPNNEEIPPFAPFDEKNTNDIVHDDEDTEVNTEYDNHTDDEGDDILHISTDDGAADNPNNGIFVEDVDDDYDCNNGIFVEDVDDDNNDSAELFADAEELFPTVPPGNTDTTTEQRSDDDNTDSTPAGPAFNTRHVTRSYSHTLHTVWMTQLRQKATMPKCFRLTSMIRGTITRTLKCHKATMSKCFRLPLMISTALVAP